ncbi:MAG: Omp28 family outer membrane lipoprotein [Candidatus Limimorpha sp.]
MKKTSLLFLSAALAFATVSCDKLNEPFFTEPIVAASDTIPMTAEDTINFDGKIVVLLEDYTGVKCNNCPAAAVTANELQEQHEGHLIVLGVHPKGALQLPNGDFPDFRTEDGNTWNNNFNIASYPNGMVNRKSVIGPAEWATAVNDEIGKNAPARVVIKTEYNEGTRELTLSIHTLFMEDVEGKINLTTCIMEDNIIGKQVTPNGIDTSYMHRHVFRGTADGITWGRTLDNTATTISKDRRFVTNMKFTVDENFNADELYIVAILSNDDTKEVLMASETKIK